MVMFLKVNPMEAVVSESDSLNKSQVAQIVGTVE